MHHTTTLSMETFIEHPAADVDPAQLHAAFGLAFADYLIGPFQLPPAQWPHFLARQCVDLALSRVLQRDGDILAFAFTAPRPALGIWRLATMGAVPAARGSGAAPRLLDNFIQRARHAGMAAVELEVFAQNTRALRLYESHGFQAQHALHGYHAKAWDQAAFAAPPAPAGVPTELTREQAFAWIDSAQREVFPDLPLQVCTPVLATNPLPLHAWQLGSAVVVFTLPEDGKLQILSLIDRNPAQQDALGLALGLRTTYPDRQSFVHELQRVDIGGRALALAGFERKPLHQLLMRRAIVDNAAPAPHNA
jgi:ribosomal protein S18 acetylase RimI-like enzyme